jgi:hypothetical protein
MAILGAFAFWVGIAFAFMAAGCWLADRGRDDR